MNRIRVTKIFDFETAHALYGYDGKCRNIHGHSYRLYVTVIGAPVEDTSHVKLGMVMDFGDLKEIVHREIVSVFDHATVLNKNSPHQQMANALKKHTQKLILTDYQPTCENMLIDFSVKIKKRLPNNIKLYSLKLQETATSYAEWYAKDN